MSLIVMMVMMVMIAINFHAQEKLFVDARKELGRSLDIFVVNSFGSLFQVREGNQ
jgi:hypothetical protein